MASPSMEFTSPASKRPKSKGELASFRAARDRWQKSPRPKLIPIVIADPNKEQQLPFADKDPKPSVSSLPDSEENGTSGYSALSEDERGPEISFPEDVHNHAPSSNSENVGTSEAAHQRLKEDYTLSVHNDPSSAGLVDNVLPLCEGREDLLVRKPKVELEDSEDRKGAVSAPSIQEQSTELQKDAITSASGSDLKLLHSKGTAAPPEVNEPDVTSAAPHSETSPHRDRLMEFYKKHNPSKLESVDTTLEAYEGREAELFRKLEEKYVKGKEGILPAAGKGTTCFLEFQYGEQGGRVEVQLFQDKVPLACENFRALCTGEKGVGRSGKQLVYRNSRIHRIVPGFCIRGGDFAKFDGTGGESIYPPGSEHADMWGNFKDELFMSHARKGLLSMANNGPNRNSSQFFVTLKQVANLDGKHVVFGEVTKGMDIIESISRIPTDKKQRPLDAVTIVDCGEVRDGVEIRASRQGNEKKSDIAGSAGTAPFSNSLDGSTSSSKTSSLTPSSGYSFAFGSTSTVLNPFSATGAGGNALFGETGKSTLGGAGAHLFGNKAAKPLPSFTGTTLPSETTEPSVQQDLQDQSDGSDSSSVSSATESESSEEENVRMKLEASPTAAEANVPTQDDDSIVGPSPTFGLQATSLTSTDENPNGTKTLASLQQDNQKETAPSVPPFGGQFERATGTTPCSFASLAGSSSTFGSNMKTGAGSSASSLFGGAGKSTFGSVGGSLFGTTATKPRKRTPSSCTTERGYQSVLSVAMTSTEPRVEHDRQEASDGSDSKSVSSANESESSDEEGNVRLTMKDIAVVASEPKSCMDFADSVQEHSGPTTGLKLQGTSLSSSATENPARGEDKQTQSESTGGPSISHFVGQFGTAARGQPVSFASLAGSSPTFGSSHAKSPFGFGGASSSKSSIFGGAANSPFGSVGGSLFGTTTAKPQQSFAGTFSANDTESELSEARPLAETEVQQEGQDATDENDSNFVSSGDESEASEEEKARLTPPASEPVTAPVADTNTSKPDDKSLFSESFVDSNALETVQKTQSRTGSSAAFQLEDVTLSTPCQQNSDKTKSPARGPGHQNEGDSAEVLAPAASVSLLGGQFGSATSVHQPGSASLDSSSFAVGSSPSGSCFDGTGAGKNMSSMLGGSLTTTFGSTEVTPLCGQTARKAQLSSDGNPLSSIAHVKENDETHTTTEPSEQMHQKDFAGGSDSSSISPVNESESSQKDDSPLSSPDSHDRQSESKPSAQAMEKNGSSSKQLSSIVSAQPFRFTSSPGSPSAFGGASSLFGAMEKSTVGHPPTSLFAGTATNPQLSFVGTSLFPKTDTIHTKTESAPSDERDASEDGTNDTTTTSPVEESSEERKDSAASTVPTPKKGANNPKSEKKPPRRRVFASALEGFQFGSSPKKTLPKK